MNVCICGSTTPISGQCMGVRVSPQRGGSRRRREEEVYRPINCTNKICNVPKWNKRLSPLHRHSYRERGVSIPLQAGATGREKAKSTRRKSFTTRWIYFSFNLVESQMHNSAAIDFKSRYFLFAVANDQ